MYEENKATWEKELAAFKASSPAYQSYMAASKKKTRHYRVMERLKDEIRMDCQRANCFVKLQGMSGWEWNPDEIWVLSHDYGIKAVSWEEAETHIDGLKVLLALESD